MYEIVLHRIKQFIFRRITRSSMGLFLRGGDTISVAPQITGTYDPDINHLVDHFTQMGHGDFLIDIGANVGLMACQNGHKFRYVHMYEPNPICVAVLRANCMMALSTVPYEIHPCALSDADRTDTLRIPKHNWGGAFIHRGNAYSDDLLSRKDGFDHLADTNYLSLQVQALATTDELGRVFKDLFTKEFFRGVIKMDVEGHEEGILLRILEVMPETMEAFVILESWDSRSGIAQVVRRATRPLDVYRYANTSRFLNFFSPGSLFSMVKELQPIQGDDWRGDIIVHLKPALKGQAQ